MPTFTRVLVPRNRCSTILTALFVLRCCPSEYPNSSPSSLYSVPTYWSTSYVHVLFAQNFHGIVEFLRAEYESYTSQQSSPRLPGSLSHLSQAHSPSNVLLFSFTAKAEPIIVLLPACFLRASCVLPLVPSQLPFFALSRCHNDGA